MTKRQRIFLRVIFVLTFIELVLAVLGIFFGPEESRYYIFTTLACLGMLVLLFVPVFTDIDSQFAVYCLYDILLLRNNPRRRQRLLRDISSLGFNASFFVGYDACRFRLHTRQHTEPH